MNPIQKLLDDFSADFQRIRARNAAKGVNTFISCTKGCSACCYEPVYAWDVEIEHILEQLSPAQIDALKPKVALWRECAEQAGIDLVTNFNKQAQEAPAFEALLHYRRARLACPFLEDNLCSIYKHRPLACRAHNATGPRASCEQDALRPTQKFVMTPAMEVHYAQRMMAMALELGRAQFDHLGLLLADALEKRAGASARHLNNSNL